VMPHLIERPFFEGEAGSDMHPDGLALNVHLHAPVPHGRDLVEFVNGEEVPDAVAQPPYLS